MERFLITVYDLDDVVYYLLTPEQYVSLDNEAPLENLLWSGHMPGDLFESTNDLIAFCVENQVRILEEESTFLPR